MGQGTFLANVAVDTPITNISVFNFLNEAGNLRFLIFSHLTETLLYVSAPKSFGADTVVAGSWKRSDDFSFTLLAGQQYDVGAIESNGAGFPGFGSPSPPVDFTQNGITSRTGDPFFRVFDYPVVTRGRDS